MATGRYSENCNNILAGITGGKSPTAASLNQQVRQGGSGLICFSVSGPHNTNYWTTVLRLVAWAIVDKQLPSEVTQGFVISFIFAFMPDPAASMGVLAKNYGLNLEINVMSFYQGVLICKTADGTKLLNRYSKHDEGELADAFNGGTYLDGTDDCDESAYNTVLMHIIMIATKAVTAPSAAVVTAKRRMRNVISTFPISDNWLMTDDSATVMTSFIGSGMILRRAITALVETADSAVSVTSSQLTVIGHAGVYLRMAGLTGFQLVCQHVLAPKAPVIGIKAYAAQINYLITLMDEYRNTGPDAPYIKFLSLHNAGKFNTSSFLFFYEFALGVASITDPTMEAYATPATLTSSVGYKLGREYAKKSASVGDKDIIGNLGLDPASVADMAKQHQEAMIAKDDDQGFQGDV